MFFRAMPVPRATARKRVFGDVERNAGLFVQSAVESLEQRTATREVDAVFHDIGVEFGRIDSKTFINAMSILASDFSSA